MKTLKSIFAALIIVSFASVSVNAQSNPTASASAASSAEIITPISIVKAENGDLLFGRIIASVAGGTVAMGTSSDTPIYTGVTAPTGNEGTRSRAAFTVSGMGTATYAITLPSSPVSLSSGSNTMNVTDFTSNPNGTGTLSSGGTETINVGATLNVGANQATGIYNGSFSVTVAYN